MNKQLILAAALAALAGCGSVSGPYDGARTVAEAHPITVDQQAVALRVAVDETRNGLDRGTLAQIEAFVTEYRTRGHGPITVTAPVGAASDRAAQDAAARVRAGLHAAGVPYEAMMGASLAAPGGGADVIASFQSYVATGPVCGRATSAAKRRFLNRRPEDFGCASQANLAAMIADPRDLHSGADGDGMGDTALVKAISERAATQTEIIEYEIEDE